VQHSPRQSLTPPNTSGVISSLTSIQAVREKEEAKAYKEKLARKKAEQAALYVEQEWAVNEGADKLTDEGWWGDGDGKKDASDAPQQELYCVACGKSFKSEKQ
jgi:DnaJ family protein A protein 5